jgi:hypothetical protein
MFPSAFPFPGRSIACSPTPLQLRRHPPPHLQAGQFHILPVSPPPTVFHTSSLFGQLLPGLPRPAPPRMSTGEALRCNALDTYPAILRSGVSSDPSPSRPRATPGSSLQRKTSLQAFAFVLNPAYFVSSLTRMTPLNLSRLRYASSIQKSPSSFVAQPSMPLSLHCQSHLLSLSPFRTPHRPPPPQRPRRH